MTASTLTSAGTRTVAVMWRPRPSDAAAIRRVFGADVVIEDGRRARRPDIVAVGPVAPETLRALRRRFPASEIVMVDTAWATAALLPPPLVERAFAAGADRYVIAVDGVPTTTYRPAPPHRLQDPERRHTAYSTAA